MSECPHPAKLLKLVSDGEYVPHLRECEKCRNFVAAAAEAMSTLNDRTELEAAVREEIDEVLANTPEYRWSSTFLDSCNVHLLRSVVVRDLFRRADELSGSEPWRALNLTRAAILVCDHMVAKGNAPAPELRFEVLKLHSSLLRDTGSLDEALSVLGRAWIVADETENREQYRAILALCGAIIYAEPDIANFDEAISLAEAAAPVLDICGDARRSVIARHTKAYALAVQNRFEEAATILRGVVDEIRDAGGTPHDAAMAHALLALCYVRLGSHGEALDHARIAEHLHEENGETVDAARAAHHAALAIAGLGRFGDVREEFTRTADVVFAAGLFDVWCVLRLDYIAAALTADSSADVRADAEGVARVAMTVGTKQSSQRRQFVAEACNYLRQIAMNDALTFEVADYVRAYVDRSFKRKPMKFARPSGASFVM